MSTPTRIGVIGTGHQGVYHIQKYQAMEGVELVGIHDLDGERARIVAGEMETTACDSLPQLLDSVDAISIAVPPQAQVEIAEAAIDLGIHVMLEKPMAPTGEQARMLITRAETNGVTLHVGHVERFNPAFRALHEQNLRPRLIDVQRTAPWQPRGTDVSVVFDLMIHDLDLLLTLTSSPVVDMDARGARVLSDHIDVATVRVTFADAAVANISASRVASEKIRSLQVFEKEGWYRADLLERRLTRSLYRHDAPEADRELNIQPADALEQELTRFVQAVKGEKISDAVTGIQAWKALCFAEDIEQAITHIPL
jgi:predicted dehydrogenase